MLARGPTYHDVGDPLRMNHRPIHLVLALLAAPGLGCQRDRAPAPAPAVQPGPNALGPDGRPRGATTPAPGRSERVGLAVGLVEGRVKPPDDKPNDDDDRHRVHPEWYPTGQPNNPYPAGTVIPIAPPPPGLSITPLPPTQGLPAPAGQGVPPPVVNNGVSMVPMGQPTAPIPTAPMPGRQPSPQPIVGNGVTMTPIPAPGVPARFTRGSGSIV